jgi:hypothetical protein
MLGLGAKFFSKGPHRFSHCGKGLLAALLHGFCCGVVDRGVIPGELEDGGTALDQIVHHGLGNYVPFYQIFRREDAHFTTQL